MINLTKAKSLWHQNKRVKEDSDIKEYKKHFQLALINLEQNLIEERLPELQRIA